MATVTGEVSDNEAIMFALILMADSPLIVVQKGEAIPVDPKNSRDMRAASAYNKLASWMDRHG